MADDVTLTSAKTPAEWVQAFYGDDAFDYKKVEKLRHIKHTGQFASFCYVISKNTKQAHTEKNQGYYALFVLRNEEFRSRFRHKHSPGA